MFVIKYGGSRVSPAADRRDDSFIDSLGEMVQRYPQEKFLVIIGGGALATKLQAEGWANLESGASLEGLFPGDRNLIEQGRMLDQTNSAKYESDIKDLLGIRATRENAAYVIHRFQHVLKIPQVCPEVVFDPNHKVKGDYRIYFAGGYKPGNSTDFPTLLLAHAYGAEHVIKVSDFPVVKDYPSDLLEGIPKSEHGKILKSAPDLHQATWEKMLELAGKWAPRKSVALDCIAAKFGVDHPGMTLYICPENQVPYALARDEKRYTATIVRG